MSSNNDVFGVLEDVNLNVNSEFTVALKRNDTWQVFEVYNQAAKHHGKLFVKNVGDYKHYNNNILLFRDNTPKYIRRKNMTGVIFKSLIVV